MRHTAKLSLLAIAVSILVAACGGSSGSSKASTSTKEAAASKAPATSASGAYSYKAESKPASSSSTSAGASTSALAAVSTRHTNLGTILVAGNGRTLYLFEADKSGKSACKGDCAGAWPPLMSHGKPRAGSGINASLLGLLPREGGTQVTYAGHPLYEYVGDQEPGQTAGQGLKSFGAAWYVISPAGAAITK